MTRQLLLAFGSFSLLILTLVIGQELQKKSETYFKPIHKLVKKFLDEPLSGASSKNLILILITLTCMTRLIPLLIMPSASNNFDVESFRLVGQKAVQGIDIYTYPDTLNRHPYLPLQVYWIGFSSWLSEKASLPFEKIVRIEPILADGMIAALVFWLVKKQADKNLAFKAGLFFALNPISWMVSVIHAQFDAVPVLFLLISLWLSIDRPGSAGIWMGLGILVKSWPVLGLPSILFSINKRRDKFVFTSWVFLIPVAGVVVYSILFQANFLTIIRQAVNYNHGIGVWGYTYLLRLLSIGIPQSLQAVNLILSYSRYITLILLAAAWILICRKENLLQSILTIFVAFFAFTHAFAIQYLSWMIPIALITMQFKWIKWFTLAAFSYMFLVYNTLIMKVAITNILPWPDADLYLIIPASIPVWLVSIAWITQRHNRIHRIENAN